MTPLRWTALIAALVLIVPATIAIVRAFWPYGRDDGEGRARALEALWTVVPVAGLVVLVAYSVAAE